MKQNQLKKSKELFVKQHLKNDLAYLKSIFFLSDAITNLEKSTPSFHKGITIILYVKDKLFKYNSEIARLVKTQITSILKKKNDSKHF